MQIIKKYSLYLLKVCGVFSLFSYINRNRSLVLCYHGIAQNDEHLFMPANYVTMKRFKKRIEKLKRNGYDFITLEELSEKIKKKCLSNKELVITIDDGFESIFCEMIPYLEEKSIPSTLYITTMNSSHNYPIFRLASAYAFWKTKNELFYPSKTSVNYQEKVETKNHQSIWKFITKVEENYDFKNRELILKEILKQLDVKLTPNLLKSFKLLELAKLEQLELNLTSIQLHTHSHDMTLEVEKLKEDIIKNKNILSDYTVNELNHFCYPSGIYNEEHFPVLKELDIETATTCEHGLVDHKTNPLAIPRLVINSNMSEIVFEAELNGLMSFFRSFKKLIPN